MGQTTFIDSNKVDRKWYVVDATDIPLGRLSSEVSRVLIGKHKPSFTPNADAGDFVVVINAEKVGLSGQKKLQKIYYRHTNHPGGIYSKTASQILDTKPEAVIEKSVKGMLPKKALGRKMLSKLKVYAGSDHPHGAQDPQPLTFRAN